MSFIEIAVYNLTENISLSTNDHLCNSTYMYMYYGSTYETVFPLQATKRYNVNAAHCFHGSFLGRYTYTCMYL